MKPKEILVFGATGNIGRNLIRKLTKNNYKVVAVTRNIHRKGFQLKTQANPGYLELVELESLNEEKIKYLLKDKGMTLNGVKKLLKSENSDIDEFNYTSIRQKNIIKTKLKNIKNLIKNIKVNNG